MRKSYIFMCIGQGEGVGFKSYGVLGRLIWN